MSLQKRPSQVLAAWIEEQIRTLQPGSLFATDKSLANRFTVSVSTVRKIMSRYVQDGLLVRIPGRGTSIAGNTPTHVPGVTKTSPVRLTEQLTKLIITGELKSGDPLPTSKELTLGYHVSSATISKAFRNLVQSGLVTRIGHRYWVGAIGTARNVGRKGEVYHLSHRDGDPVHFLRYNVCVAAYPRMERELALHGLTVKYSTTYKLKELASAWLERGWMPSAIIIAAKLNDRIRVDKWVIPEIAKIGHSCGQRIPVLVEGAHTDLRALDKKTMHLLNRGHMHTLLSRALADFVVKKRYESVTFFLDLNREESDQTICDMNLNGKKLRAPQRTVERSGSNADFIRSFATHNIWQPLKMRQELRRIDESIPWTLMVRVASDIRTSEELWQRAHELLANDSIRAMVRKYKMESGESICRDISIAHEFSTAFASAPRNGLWIFGSDDHALAALAWLEMMSIAVPQQVSVLTLENHPSFLAYGISYCEPDWDHLGYVMAHALIGDVPLEKSTHEFLNSRMVIMNRSTT